MSTLLRTVVWQGISQPSLEQCRFWQTRNGEARLEGTAVLARAGEPFLVRYAVECTAAWQTRSVRIELERAAVTAVLTLRADERQRWWLEEDRLPALDGCHDIDLGWTSATNTLPIRRLGLAVGEARDVTAAWARFPDLAIQPLPQRYTRLADRRYRYESRGGGFVAEVEVDELGLVTSYPPGWERVPSAEGRRLRKNDHDHATRTIPGTPSKSASKLISRRISRRSITATWRASRADKPGIPSTIFSRFFDVVSFYRKNSVHDTEQRVECRFDRFPTTGFRHNGAEFPAAPPRSSPAVTELSSRR